MAKVSEGDMAVWLTLIEMHSRHAREALATGVRLRGTPEGVVRPGDPPKPHSNLQMAQAAFQMHAHEVMVLRGVALSWMTTMDAPEPDISPTAGRIGPRLNGTHNGEAP